MISMSLIQSGFNQIASASGKSKQIALQQIANKNNDCWIALYYLLNPMMTYGIGKLSLNRKIDKTPTHEYYSLFQMLDDLSTKKGINDQTIRNVQYFIEKNSNYKDLIIGMVTKSITLGVTAKTVNKVIDYEYIPEFTVMLANKYFEHMDVVVGKSFTLTEKLDGIRCCAILSEGSVHLFSRQGQPIDGLVDVEDDLMKIYDYIRKKPVVFDGELLIKNRNDYASKDQYKQTTKIVRSDGEKHGIVFNVFDVVDYDSFLGKQCNMPYYLRRQRLVTFVSDNLDNVKVVPVLYSGDDIDMIQHYLDIERSLHHEGIMINLNDAVYDYKRTNHLLKCKVMQDCDLVITGVEEGSGKFAGTLGSLVVDYKGNPVGVGSGISDDLRKKIWANPSEYIGRIATVQYFEETQNNDGKLSIRFPVLKDIREDGKEVSYN